jgi:hypothetical protein
MHGQIGWGELWVRVADEPRVRAALVALQTAPARESTDNETPAVDQPEPPRSRRRKGLGGLWLLVALGVVLLGLVLASAIIGSPNECDQEEDALKRAQCQQHREVPPPQRRDWP